MNRGVAICTYRRADVLGEVIESILNTTPNGTRVVVCDDGSPDDTHSVVAKFPVTLIAGPNLGVAANKNRALWGLQDCTFFAIIEDDLVAMKKGWFELYEKAVFYSGIHHFCRVQDKLVQEEIPAFGAFMEKNGLTTIYASSPRGDLTFGTREVIKKVGAFNPGFKGAGYAHGEWSNRVDKAGLIGHPAKWVDIRDARDSFIQKGDRENGRWNLTESELRLQLKGNRQYLKRLNRKPYIYHPLVLT